MTAGYSLILSGVLLNALGQLLLKAGANAVGRFEFVADNLVPVATRFAFARFAGHELELFWLEAYGGGLFLPFRDATGGSETYGGGRYLLDTIKGADLGAEGHRLVLDFNFAYNPSCAYDPKWACPLSPPANRLTVRVEAGEKKPEVGLEPTAH